MSFTILNRTILEKKNTKNLLYILKQARAYAGSVANASWCSDCRDFHSGDREADLKKAQPYFDYIQTLKEILKAREHVEKKLK